MKKLIKITSMILALVLIVSATAMPAFACSSNVGCPDDCNGWSYGYTDGTWTNGHLDTSKTLACAYYHNTDTVRPYLFGTEEKRDYAYKYRVNQGKATAAYYVDANGDLYTDMPAYGGTLIAKSSTPEWDKAVYGTVKANTWARNAESKRSTAKAVGTVKTADTTPVGFTDVSANAWYADAVNALANTGIILGDGNGHFMPNDNITWQQMYWILERLLGVNGDYLPTSTTRLDSREIVGALMGWYDNAAPANDKTLVNRAEAASIVATLYSLRPDHDSVATEYSYYADHTLGGYWVNNAVSGLAQQAAANGAKVWTVSMIPDGDKLLQLTDSKYASASIYDSTYDPANVIDVANILRAYTLGLIRGTDANGTLNPAGNLTRAEFCQMLYNAGVFGCVYPNVSWYSVTMKGLSGNGNADHLKWYMDAYRTDGTPVEN